MNFLNRMERQYGKYAISNLMLYIIMGNVVVFFLTHLDIPISEYIYFNPELIIKGQVWRLFTFVFIPNIAINSTGIIWLIFSSLLYYSIGSQLEHTWGTFKFNVYYLLGMVFNMLALTVFYYAFSSIIPYSVIPYSVIPYSYFFSALAPQITYYLNLSLFLAFAALFPDVQFFLYGILPIKVKYLAVLDGLLILYSFINSGLAPKILIVVSLLNFFLFFGKMLLGKRPGGTSTQRNFKAAQRELKQGPPIPVAFHKCTVCGKTELTDPDMEFRYCSKCNGNYEYCMDHLHNHEHKQ